MGKDFSNWIKDRIEKYGFVDGEDLAVDSPNLANQTGVDGEDYVTVFPNFGENNLLTEEVFQEKLKNPLGGRRTKGQHKGPGARAPGPVLPSGGLCRG